MVANSILGCINKIVVCKLREAIISLSSALESGIQHPILDPPYKKDADKLQQVQGRANMEYLPCEERLREIDGLLQTGEEMAGNREVSKHSSNTYKEPSERGLH